MSYGIESHAEPKALEVLGFKSESKYLSSKLYRNLGGVVLKRDGRKCQSLLCRSDQPATAVTFLHKPLAAYLGIGLANIAATCPDCSTFFATLKPDGVFFALSGLRKRGGHSRPDIGRWYGKRFEANQELARAFLADYLGEKNRRFVVSLIDRQMLPAFYREYLGLTNAALSDQTTTD